MEQKKQAQERKKLLEKEEREQGKKQKKKAKNKLKRIQEHVQHSNNQDHRYQTIIEDAHAQLEQLKLKEQMMNANKEDGATRRERINNIVQRLYTPTQASELKKNQRKQEKEPAKQRLTQQQLQQILQEHQERRRQIKEACRFYYCHMLFVFSLMFRCRCTNLLNENGKKNKNYCSNSFLLRKKCHPEL
jgi:hypothetical protein